MRTNPLLKALAPALIAQGLLLPVAYNASADGWTPPDPWTVQCTTRSALVRCSTEYKSVRVPDTLEVLPDITSKGDVLYIKLTADLPDTGIPAEDATVTVDDHEAYTCSKVAKNELVCGKDKSDDGTSDADLVTEMSQGNKLSVHYKTGNDMQVNYQVPLQQSFPTIYSKYQTMNKAAMQPPGKDDNTPQEPMDTDQSDAGDGEQQQGAADNAGNTNQ